MVAIHEEGRHVSAAIRCGAWRLSRSMLRHLLPPKIKAHMNMRYVGVVRMCAQGGAFLAEANGESSETS